MGYVCGIGVLMSHIYYSELCLIGGDVSRNVDRLVEAGADGVELMLDGAGWDGVYDRPGDYASASPARASRTRCTSRSGTPT